MKYFWLTVRHKWYVLLAARKIGVPLWRALLHDLSKFTLAELPHYDRQFCGPKDDPGGFAKAWLHHYHRNAHHWEHWIVESLHSHSSPDRDECIVDNCLRMPDAYILEMIADWMGASKAYTGSWDMKDWLIKNLGKMKFHPGTRARVMALLAEVI